MAGIFLNFFETIFNFNETEVLKLPYLGREQFEYLRNNNKDFWSYRSGSDVLIWNYKNSNNKLNSTEIPSKIMVGTAEFPYIYSQMIKLGIEQLLISKGYTKLYSNFGIESYLGKNNLTKEITGLDTYHLLLISTYYTQNNGQVKIGFTLDFKLYHKFSLGKQDFIKKSIDVRGLKIKNDNTVIANRPALQRFTKAIGQEAEFNKIVQKSISAKEIYKLVEETSIFIKNNTSDIFLNKNLEIKDIIKINLPYGNNFFKSEKFLSPTYYYNNQSIVRGSRPSDAVKAQKPFSYQQFKNQTIRILFVAGRKHQGNAEVFIKKLCDNLQEKFYLSIRFTDKYFESNNDISEQYKNIIYETIGNTGTEKFDLVIPIIEEEYKNLEITKNPYFLLKAKLIGQGIPTQEITIEKVKSLNGGNEYILNNISLSVYAKIGGTAWTIEKIDPLRNEIIIGIGSSVTRSENDEKRVVGFATVFDYSGKYIVGDCSPISLLDDYTENLKTYLIKIIGKIITNRSLSKDKELRLIFHLYKSAGRKRELVAIQKVMEHFKDYEIKFSLLHIGYGHNFKIYNNCGNDSIDRGFVINLSSNHLLLNFINKITKGNPSPLSIHLDARSTFTDLNYLAKQVFFFSFISFRSFTPSKKPITILYPSIMTKLTEQMKMIPSWDFDKLQYIGEKQWFL